MTVAPRITFLTYDSRSGSTWLSSALAKRFANLAVTPEFGFDPILAWGRGDHPIERALAAVQEIARDPNFRSWDLTEEELLAAVRPLGPQVSARAAIEAICLVWLARRHPSSSGDMIVKNGRHLRYWREIRQIFGEDARLIFLVRDPRAVVDSKLKTPRPYYPFEVMAWGGAIGAAYRWSAYADLARQAAKAGVRVLEVKYEQLGADEAAVLDCIGGFLGIAVVAGREGDYVVPESERAIHVRAGRPFDPAKLEAWRTSLTPRDASVVEAMCGSNMRALGYRVERRPLGQTVQAWLVAAPETAVRIVRHYWLHLMFRLGMLRD